MRTGELCDANSDVTYEVDLYDEVVLRGAWLTRILSM
jgi:hypothetical protein